MLNREQTLELGRQLAYYHTYGFENSRFEDGYLVDTSSGAWVPNVTDDIIRDVLAGEPPENAVMSEEGDRYVPVWAHEDDYDDYYEDDTDPFGNTPYDYDTDRSYRATPPRATVTERRPAAAPALREATVHRFNLPQGAENCVMGYISSGVRAGEYNVLCVWADDVGVRRTSQVGTFSTTVSEENLAQTLNVRAEGNTVVVSY